MVYDAKYRKPGAQKRHVSGDTRRWSCSSAATTLQQTVSLKSKQNPVKSQMQCFLQEPSAIWRIGEIQDSSMVWTDKAMDSSCSCLSLSSDQEKINRLPGNRAETHESKTCETLGNGSKGDYGINYRTIFESVHLLYQHYQNLAISFMGKSECEEM